MADLVTISIVVVVAILYSIGQYKVTKEMSKHINDEEQQQNE